MPVRMFIFEDAPTQELTFTKLIMETDFSDEEVEILITMEVGQTLTIDDYIVKRIK